ncbi:large ribosomal subunit protein mL43 isoform 2-T2 [Cariama cristata]
MTGRGSPSRFLAAVLHNGVGRYVRQLQRLQLLFSPTAADARGARQFVEEAALDFARQHPDVVLYISPRSGRAPLLLAEYSAVQLPCAEGRPAGQAESMHPQQRLSLTPGWTDGQKLSLPPVSTFSQLPAPACSSWPPSVGFYT